MECLAGVVLSAIVGVACASAPRANPESGALRVGCYEILANAEYGPPMRSGSPWTEPPPDYPGPPQVVRVDATRDQSPALDIVVTTVKPAAWSYWSPIEIVGDSLHLFWAASPGYWGIRHTLHRSSLEGVSWYWSHVLLAPGQQHLRVPTRWRASGCPGRGGNGQTTRSDQRAVRMTS
jgi:hypothetical protein